MRHLLCCLFILALLPVSYTLAATSPITLVYVSHMADISSPRGVSAYPKLVTLMAELRKNGERALLFHGGNVLGPSALASYDKGAHIVGILNSLRPDVLGLGRRDFMHKEDELVLRTGEAVFPIVCSNVYDPISLEPPGNSQRSYMLRRSAPMGFLALVSPEMQTTYIQKRLVTTGSQELLPALVDELHQKGARFVAATADFMPDMPMELMDEADLDLLFVSGGVTESAVKLQNGRCLALHSGNGDDVLALRLTPDGKGGLEVSEHKILHLADYAPDPKMIALIERYTKLFVSLTQVEVGTVLTPLDTRTRLLRSGENSMGNLVADAMRDYYGADVALMNSGGIRGNRVYEAGVTLRRGDLQNEMPLHDMSCLVQVQGAVIMEALEHGLSQIEEAKGRFLQVSGLRYSYDPSMSPGSRVVSASIAGKPLERNKIYSVSLPEYLNHHGDGFYMFPGECSVKAPRPQQELVEIVRVYLSLHSPVSPRVDGRIQRAQAAR